MNSTACSRAAGSGMSGRWAGWLHRLGSRVEEPLPPGLGAVSRTANAWCHASGAVRDHEAVLQRQRRHDTSLAARPRSTGGPRPITSSAARRNPAARSLVVQRHGCGLERRRHGDTDVWRRVGQNDVETALAGGVSADLVGLPIAVAQLDLVRYPRPRHPLVRKSSCVHAPTASTITSYSWTDPSTVARAVSPVPVGSSASSTAARTVAPGRPARSVRIARRSSAGEM